VIIEIDFKIFEILTIEGSLGYIHNHSCIVNGL